MNKAIEWTLRSCGAILILTGLAKIVSSQGSVPILAAADSIFALPYSTLMLSVGILEILVAVVCFSRRIGLSKRVLVLCWITAAFFFYRTGLWWLGSKAPCMCLGSLADSLHISAHTTTILADISFGILFIGSALASFLCLREKATTQARV